MNKFGLWVAVYFLAGKSMAFAQAGSTLAGVVQDPTGAVISHAHIALRTEKGSALVQADTDPLGVFHLVGVARGTYVLLVTEPGFQEAKQAITVPLSGTKPIVIKLKVEVNNETVNVSDADAGGVNTAIDANRNANTLDRKALDRLPILDAGYVAMLSRFLDPDALATSGVSLVVNGVEANGPGVTPSAITSIKINRNPYSVLFSRPGRARIELETEGGTPQFHGSATFLYRDAVFDAQPAFAFVKPAEQRTYYEGSLTGPLSHSGKTTFVASLDRDNDNQEAIVHAAAPSGPVDENVPNPLHHYFLSGRVFHDYVQSNQLWIGYSFEHETDTNVGVGGTVLSQAGTDLRSFEHEINVQDSYVFSPTFVNLGHFLIGHNIEQVSSTTGAVQIDVPGSFTGGGAQADTLRTESHFDGTDIVTYSSGKHTAKLGIDIPDISRRAFDDSTNRLGTYSFDSLQSYAPFQYILQTGSGHVSFVEKVFAGFAEDEVRVSPKLSLAAGVRYYFQNYFNDRKHDIAPRASFAYAPSVKGATVVRGGAGMFFDRTGPGPIADLLHFNGVNTRRFILRNPGFPATPAQVAAEPSSLVTLDARARIPHTLQFGIGLERQINAKSSLSVNYTGSRGMDLFRSIDTNAPFPPTYAGVPNPQLGQVRQIQSEGQLKSDSLEISFQGEPGKFFTGQTQYVLGKTYNNTGGIAYFPADSYRPEADWARSDNDARHKLNLLGTAHASNWFDVGIAFSAHSGLPVDVTTGDDNNHDGIINDRPIGTPRNSLHGPGYLDLDLNLSREFALAKEKKTAPTATFSLSAFNVPNRQNDFTYVGVVTSPFFRQPVSAEPSRRMQLTLQLKF